MPEKFFHFSEKTVPVLKQADWLLQPYTYAVAGFSLVSEYFESLSDLSLSEWVLVTALVTGAFNSFFAATRFIEYWRKVFRQKGPSADDDQCQ